MINEDINFLFKLLFLLKNGIVKWMLCPPTDQACICANTQWVRQNTGLLTYPTPLYILYCRVAICHVLMTWWQSRVQPGIIPQ